MIISFLLFLDPFGLFLSQLLVTSLQVLEDLFLFLCLLLVIFDQFDHVGSEATVRGNGVVFRYKLIGKVCLEVDYLLTIHVDRPTPDSVKLEARFNDILFLGIDSRHGRLELVFEPLRNLVNLAMEVVPWLFGNGEHPTFYRPKYQLGKQIVGFVKGIN